MPWRTLDFSERPWRLCLVVGALFDAFGWLVEPRRHVLWGTAAWVIDNRIPGSQPRAQEVKSSLGNSIAADVEQTKISNARAALLKQLADLDQREKEAREKASAAAVQRLADAFRGMDIAGLSASDAKRFARAVAAHGIASATGLLEREKAA